MTPTMNMSGDFPQEAVLIEERYPAKLHSVEEYERDYGDGPVAKLAWLFEVEATADDIDPDIDYEGEVPEVFEVAAHTSFATGPNSNFAKLGFPSLVGEDWTGNTDDLIGKRCIVDVTTYEGRDGKIRNVIEKVRPPKKAGGGASAKKKTKVPDVDESDFDDIPFAHYGASRLIVEGIL